MKKIKKAIALLLMAGMCMGIISCNKKTEISTEAPTDAATDVSASSTEKPTEKPTDKKEEYQPLKKLTHKEAIITAPVSGLNSVRDPFVLLHDGKYYVYATGWTVSTAMSTRLGSTFVNTHNCVTQPSDYKGDCWAPEVYYYNGQFYMFTTYRSTKNDRRGCAIFIADNPEGPFVLHSDGHVTPSDWNAIDGTLYVDDDGQPWMIFVYEWNSTPDGIGRMACAKLSDDLTHFISEPQILFKADDPKWAGWRVTDGCFMYKTNDGQLLMIWSNTDVYGGYCVGISRSVSGEVTGPWTHDEELLYSKIYINEYDGGHGMIFRDTEDLLWMAIHSPNEKVGERREMLVFIPICEERGTFVWDLYER